MTVDIVVRTIDEASGKIKEINIALDGTTTASEKVASSTKTASLSFTELRSIYGTIGDAIQKVNQAYDATVGELQKYAKEVRDVSFISGQSAEETSRFIQVLDDFDLTAQDAMTATKALTKQGLVPNIETLAKLSDQYISITDVQERNAFVVKNLGRSGIEWNNILSQGSAKLRENAAAVQDGLILNQKMLDQMKQLHDQQDQLNDMWEATKIQIGEAAVPLISNALDNFNKRAQESNFWQAILTTGFDDIGSVIWDTGHGVNAAAEAVNNLNTSESAAIPTAEELAAAQKKVSDANMEFMSTLQSLQNAENTYTSKSMDLTNQRHDVESKLQDLRRQGYSEYSSQVQEQLTKLDEIKGKEAELAAQRDLDQKKFILGLLQQRLAQDGLSTDELNYLLLKGQQWGVYSSKVVSDAQKAIGEIDHLVAAMNAIPNIHRQIDITTNFTTTGAAVGTGQGNAEAWMQANLPGRASGGSVKRGQAYMVGENGPEPFIPGEDGTIIPNSGAGGITVNLTYAPGMSIHDESAVTDFVYEGIRKAKADGIIQ